MRRFFVQLRRVVGLVADLYPAYRSTRPSVDRRKGPPAWRFARTGGLFGSSGRLSVRAFRS